MKIAVEISFYPFIENVMEEVNSFINRLKNYKNISFQTNFLSTHIAGDYTEIMELLNNELRYSFENNKSIFIIKITNAYNDPVNEMNKEFKI